VRRSVAAVWWRRNRCAWIGGSGGDVVHSRPDSRRARAEERGWTAAGCGETRRRIGRRQRRHRHPADCINTHTHTHTHTHTRAYRRRTPFHIGLLLHDRYQRGLVHVHGCDPQNCFFCFFESIIDPLMRMSMAVDVTMRYDIRDAILTCAQKLTRVGLLYRTVTDNRQLVLLQVSPQPIPQAHPVFQKRVLLQPRIFSL